ncbi:MAG: hypothetical protein PHU23_12150 [Dehalococcoidales bacterium]|nr:hypothetical protein [Dehalococcoidales bacterium]
MMPESAMAAIDDRLNTLFTLLLNRGLTLKQKRGYKAGKLSATRNWCHIVDGNVKFRNVLPASQGQEKTWKLFARFDTRQPPSWPWEKLERNEGKPAYWAIAGNDVWGVAYEDLWKWTRGRANKQILERLTNDLQLSFNYSRQRYC